MILELQQQLGINSSFFPQLAIFLFLFFWLKFVFFTPYLQLIQKREGQSDGLSDASSKLEEEAQQLEQQYADAFSAAKKRARAEREKIVTAAKKEASVSVAAARESAKQSLEKARETAAQEYTKEMEALGPQVANISGMLADKLTKTKVGI